MHVPASFSFCTSPTFQLERPITFTRQPEFTLTRPPLDTRYPQVIEPVSNTQDDSLCDTIYAHVKIDDNYVKAVCRRFMGRGVDFDELYSLAQDGVLHAAEKYDTSHRSAAKFQTYATFWIQERILQRFKDMKKETETLEHLKHVAPLYASQLEYEPVDIPDDLFLLFLGHIQECTEIVMEAPRATIQMYGELLSAGEKYPYSEAVMMRRQEMERLLYPIIYTFLQSETATEIYMKRFGAKIADFGEIGDIRDVSSQRACAEFTALCERVVWACNDPIMQNIAHLRYKQTMEKESQNVLPQDAITLD